ncbi:MAG: gliding motility-associated C-terminal domain-containing protein, partial [Bacteroidales bacterium]|nr:gliding motility-associated C-terminal domain-containing protein [Bacteroidales bacterium]
AGFSDLYEPEKVAGLMEGDYFVMISDTLGCKLKHDFSVEAYGMPEIELSTDKIDDDGNTVVDRQNPAVTFYFENPLYDSLGADTFQINSWTWDFGDESTSILMAPTHNYKETGTFNVNFEFVTFYNCEDIDSIKVEVKPVQLNIPNVITPNGDGVNENFVIDIEDGGGEEGGGETFKSSADVPDLNEFYLSNTLVIFNRWGQELYKIDDYKNDWNGENFVDGVYFFVLKCHGKYRDDVYKGSITILRQRF